MRCIWLVRSSSCEKRTRRSRSTFYDDIGASLLRIAKRGIHKVTMSTHQLHTDHARLFEHNRFVYPVLSRRSGGISIGVNLNPDKVCNFDCIYCQVDRRSEAETRFVESDRLRDELDVMLDFVASGRIYEDPRFCEVPVPLRRLNDIAFSGDGEPTTFRNFDDIIAMAAELKQRHRLSDVKLLLITNATMFHRPAVARGLETL